jgi:biopolymer transport protein ExbB
MIELLLAGGPFMFATLVCSIIVVMIFISRMIFLFFRIGKNTLLHTELAHLIEDNRIKEALRLCTANPNSPLGRIIQAALQRANRSEREIRRAVEASVVEEVPRVKGATVYLPQLSNLATLLGLIGTIHGLIISFSGASGGAVERQAALSKGIAIAFYNTFFGLTVATMGIIFYLILLAKTNQLIGLMERGTANTIDTLLAIRERHAKAG